MAMHHSLARYLAHLESPRSAHVPTILVLLSHSAHVVLEAAVQHSAHGMYRARRGSAPWLIAPARRARPVAPVILYWERVLALRRCWRQQVEALCGPPWRAG
jgi:hypothetical protein